MTRRIDEFDQLIAKRIRARRLQIGMNQETLANSLGLTSSLNQLAATRLPADSS